ncbi:RNA methyltransferase [Moheibacter sediminis]|uniref:RNA methyltransferase, TrmH family n=1 Tax=Moheibacter sediminis TaxID=1434700 RepID=A0A1W2BSD6_9FLAO|nr:RNA methyltransferase [Moheibacter sediminis]SMC75791.1 RNA methyltransferase, TrmH family [Moheibacter sediminis]
MLTNSDSKLINSLVKKKFRQKYNKFTVEGVKIIDELIKSPFRIDKIYTTSAIFNSKSVEQILISENELKKISQLVQPNTALALCEIPQQKKMNLNGLVIALDDIRDPGNLGTIIRLADWFGIEQIICSYETVDIYNSKVIQATMGSFLRVQVNYVDLKEVFSTYKNPILGTFMDGKNIYKMDFPSDAILLMGNEANGISDELIPFVSHRITIPRFGKLQQTESLNVAMATGILLSEFNSAQIKKS